MRIIFWLVFTFTLAITITLFFKDPVSSNDIQGSPISTLVTPLKKNREMKRSNILINESIKDLPSSKTNPNTKKSLFANLPHVCELRLREIASLSGDDFRLELQQGRFLDDSECVQSEKDFLSSIPSLLNLNMDIHHCMKLISKNTNGDEDRTKAQDCYTTIVYFRASIIDQLYDDENVAALPPQVLANKLIIGMEKAFNSTEDHSKALGLVKELIGKEPDLYAAHKSLAILNMLDASGAVNFDSPEFISAINTCKEFDVNDPELDEIEFMRLAMTEKSRMRTFAYEVITENPESAIGHYFVAADAFKSGDRKKAIKHLQIALQYAPDDARVFETLQMAVKADFSEKIFLSKLSVHFDDKYL